MPQARTSDLHPILQALARVPSYRAGAPADARAEERFCAEGRLALDAMAVRVQGCGALAQPVADEAAQALHSASTPALYGQREATLLDTRVRDTGEIGPQALELDWTEGTLAALQREVAQALGLPGLEARLHNLLVYGPEQFFKPHQDTEKHPGMVATLVLVWPSAHIGGELRVSHGGQHSSFASQHLRADALRWFAFYADCRHEVLPVSEGWRIVLTFDLVVPAKSAQPRAPVPPALLAALREQFYPGGVASSEPWAFLLDHEYTEHGLRWPLLKGDDRPRVGALRAAAEDMGLSVHLALAEIHEQWTATPSYSGRYDDDGDPEPEELLDEDMVLDFWVDAAGRPVRGQGKLCVSLDDTASFTETGEDFLVNEEYEGYMGNYGETLDYWYRRAALVIQTPQAAAAKRFTIDFDAALADALEQARAGQGQALVPCLQAAAGELAQQCSGQGRTLLAAYAELAVALPDDAQAQAQALCASFDWTQFQPEDAPVLARLAQCRGTAWMQALLQAWAAGVNDRGGYGGGWREPPTETALWPRPLAPFLAACWQAGLAEAIVDCMQECGLRALVAADADLARLAPAWRAQALPWRLRRAGELAAALGQTQHLAQLLRHVRAQPAMYSLLQLRPLLQALPASAVEAQSLRADAMQALWQALEQAPLDADDCRLEGVAWTCRCADCTPAIAWAESPDGQPLTLSMAQARREHVQQALQKAFADFGFETVRRGSPHKLVIRKPANLHVQRQAARQVWADDLAALQGMD